MELNAKLTKAHKLFSLFYVLLPIPILAYMFFDGSKLSTLLIGFSLFAFFAAIHFVAAIGAYQGKKWGRLMSRVIGAFMLLGFPIGTAIGIYLLSCTESIWQPSNEI
jgi:hypothetical protein